MHIEFQTTADNFLYQFREKLRAIPMPITAELPDGNRLRIVNRVVFGNGTQLRFEKAHVITVQVPAPGSAALIEGKRFEVAQPVTIELVYLDQLIAAGEAPVQPPLPLDVFVIFEMALSVVGGDVLMTTTYDSVEGFLPPSVLASLDVQLSSAAKPQTSRLDLDDLKEIIGGLEAVNAGIACHPTLIGTAPFTVAMRVEFDEPRLGASEWQRFHNGFYDNLLKLDGMRPNQPASAAERRWAVFVGKEILQRFVRKTLEDSFATNDDLKLRSAITVAWRSQGNEPVLDATFKAIGIEACDLGALGRHDIRLDVQIPIRISVPQDGVLRQYLKVNFWKDDVDAGACIVAASLFWPLVAAPMVSSGKLRWDFYAWLVVLVPLRFYFVTKAANEPPPIKPPKPEMKRLSDDEFESVQPFSDPNKPSPLVLLDYRGLTTGLVLMGTQPVQPETCPALIKATYCDFEFLPPRIPCSHVAETPEGALAQSVIGNVYGAASCTVRNVGDPGCSSPRKLRLQKWEHRFLDQRLADLLHVQVQDEFYDEAVVVGVRCRLPPPEYFDDPRPLRLLVKTNGGARVITFAALERLDDDEVSRLAVAGAAKSINDCKQLLDPWWRIVQRINPRWLVDPPPYEQPNDRRLWVMRFTGLAAADRLGAALGTRPVQAMRATSGGQAMLVAVQRARSEDALELAYEPATEVPTTPGRMFMTQVALTAGGQCSLSAPVRSLASRDEHGRRRLYALHESGFSVIDLSVPMGPVLVTERHGEHLRGLAVDAEGLLCFGGREPRRLDPLLDGQAGRAGAPADARTVRCVEAGDAFYVVRERSVDVYDRDLRPRPSIALRQEALDAVLVGQRLVIAGSEGLSIVELDNPRRAATELAFAPVDAIRHSDFAMLPGTVIARYDDRFALLELPLEGVLDNIVVLAEYEEMPWYVDVLVDESFVCVPVKRGIDISVIVGRNHVCPRRA